MEAMGHVFISGALPENLEHNIYFYLFIFLEWRTKPFYRGPWGRVKGLKGH